jgi:hypothetical protein
VHDRVTGLAVGGVLPAAALPRGNRAQAAAWWRGFRFEVIRDAQRLGPSRNRCSRPAQLALQVAAVLPAAVAAAAVAPADSDPVSLLTAEEVSAAFGRPLGPPRSLTGDGTLPFLGVRMCEYAAVGDRASVQVQTVTGRIARALLERLRGEPLPGIGEEAYLRGDAVAVLQGDVGIAIRVQHVDRAAVRVGLCRLAATAAGRLPASQRPA